VRRRRKHPSKVKLSTRRSTQRRAINSKMRANAVRVQLGGCATKTHLYTKPYTKRVDALCMPCGYQPPKF